MIHLRLYGQDERTQFALETLVAAGHPLILAARDWAAPISEVSEYLIGRCAYRPHLFGAVWTDRRFLSCAPGQAFPPSPRPPVVWLTAPAPEALVQRMQEVNPEIPFEIVDAVASDGLSLEQATFFARTWLPGLETVSLRVWSDAVVSSGLSADIHMFLAVVRSLPGCSYADMVGAIEARLVERAVNRSISPLAAAKAIEAVQTVSNNTEMPLPVRLQSVWASLAALDSPVDVPLSRRPPQVTMTSSTGAVVSRPSTTADDSSALARAFGVAP